jgi:hypothetical protein
MRVWFGRPLRRVERDGWVFVDGAAYVAVRPAFGGYRWDEAEPRWMRPAAGDAPVIIQAASRIDFADFAAFQQAVLAAPLRIHDGALTFSGLNDAGQITFDFTAGQLPVINGVLPNVAPQFVNQSPFVYEPLNTGHIVVEKSSRRLVINF